LVGDQRTIAAAVERRPATRPHAPLQAPRSGALLQRHWDESAPDSAAMVPEIEVDSVHDSAKTRIATPSALSARA
jgi:hypothetical protein